jgi:hypothetical protein
MEGDVQAKLHEESEALSIGRHRAKTKTSVKNYENSGQRHCVEKETGNSIRTIVVIGVLLAIVIFAGSALMQRGRIDALPLQ